MNRASAKSRALGRLIKEINGNAAETARMTGRAAFKPAVMAVIRSVPREEFVLQEDRDRAYVNRPLGIGFGQTISQPYIVALMSDILDLEPHDKVLEIGTGCGYQTAVLAELAGQVYSVELVEDLSMRAGETLAKLNYSDVRLKVGNGRDGWADHAPYQAIMVTAAGQDVPGKLVEQLDRGGRMIIPVGPEGGPQNLILITKDQTGSLSDEAILPVAFVPLVDG